MNLEELNAIEKDINNKKKNVEDLNKLLIELSVNKADKTITLLSILIKADEIDYHRTYEYRMRYKVISNAANYLRDEILQIAMSELMSEVRREKAIVFANEKVINEFFGS